MCTESEPTALKHAVTFFETISRKIMIFAGRSISISTNITPFFFSDHQNTKESKTQANYPIQNITIYSAETKNDKNIFNKQ
jgi:hypothetical protein